MKYGKVSIIGYAIYMGIKHNGMKKHIAVFESGDAIS